MKKLFFAVFVLLMSSVASSQDTLDLASPKANYFYNTWPDSMEISLNQDYIPFWPNKYFDRMTTPDSLRIYGIAVALETPKPVEQIVDNNDAVYPIDATAPMKTQLMLAYHDTTGTPALTCIGDTLTVEAGVTPVSYYIRFNLPIRGVMPDTAPVHQVYELYYDSALSVVDSFYVGFGQPYYRNAGMVPMPMKAALLGSRDEFMVDGLEGSVAYYSENIGWKYWMRVVRVYMFPILTPQPENPGPGEQPGDTTGISQADMVSRYVTVQPNPATEEAQVLSSFGLQRIDAYTADGRCILSQEANGLQATLDVRGWASGTYLLRVATPMGTATKKLLVR